MIFSLYLLFVNLKFIFAKNSVDIYVLLETNQRINQRTNQGKIKSESDELKLKYIEAAPRWKHVMRKDKRATFYKKLWRTQQIKTSKSLQKVSKKTPKVFNKSPKSVRKHNLKKHIIKLQNIYKLNSHTLFW